MKHTTIFHVKYSDRITFAFERLSRSEARKFELALERNKDRSVNGRWVEGWTREEPTAPTQAKVDAVVRRMFAQAGL